MKCSQCGAEISEGTNFCGSCGTNLDQQPTQPQTQPIQPQVQYAQPQNKENTGKQKMPTWAKVLSVILALVILVTGSLVVFNVIPLSNSVKVPYVIGESKTSAKETLLKKKLFILVVGKKDSENDIAKNLICDQIPGEGTKLEKNSAVSVYLSKGPKMGYMPEIVYHTLDSAKEKIDEQGLGVQIAYEQSDEVAKNGVIKQETSSETPVQQGKTVKITVSEGSDKAVTGKYRLPNIVGKDFDTARTELLKNGVYLLINEAKFDDNIPKNQIMVQDKANGTTVNKGETVYVTISLGKEKVRVPDVTYMDRDEAVSSLEALGLTVSEAEGNDPDVNENLILAQSAEAGTLLEKGATITLTVNKWEEEDEEKTEETTEETTEEISINSTTKEAETTVKVTTTAESKKETNSISCYIPIIEEEINATKKNSYIDINGYGFLYDINNDSVDELVILNFYPIEDDVYDLSYCGYSVYGIKNEKITTKIYREILFYEAGGPEGHISIANYQGNTVFVTYTNNGGDWRKCIYTIYNTDNFQKIASATVTRDYFTSETVRIDECAINEKSCTYNEYLSFVDSIKPIKTLDASINYLDDKTNYEEMKLNNLLNYIKTSTAE